MSLTELNPSISSSERLEEILAEVETELGEIQPKIDALEKQVEELKELKLSKQKLITLKLSVKSILENFSGLQKAISSSEELSEKTAGLPPFESKALSSSLQGHFTHLPDTSKTFLPDAAFEKANAALRQKTSLNYEIFRAIVFRGGRASTEEIKAYLVENQITQPQNGQGFQDVPLTDISSRANYLVRKGLVQPDGRGVFYATVGWEGD